MTGEWPTEIDHINLNRADNRWLSLRDAKTRVLNCANQLAHTNNSSGFKGVHRRHRRSGRGKWQSQIMVNNKKHHLGYFDTPERAFAAYAFAARKHSGAFARLASGRWAPLINKIITRLERIGVD